MKMKRKKKFRYLGSFPSVSTYSKKIALFSTGRFSVCITKTKAAVIVTAALSDFITPFYY